MPFSPATLFRVSALAALAATASIAPAIPHDAKPTVIVSTAAELYDSASGRLTLLGRDEKLTWSQNAGALTIEAPRHVPNDIAVVFQITPATPL